MYLLEVLTNQGIEISNKRYVTGILFAISAFISAFFFKRWFGKLLVVLYFIVNGLIPMLFGVASAKIKSKLIKQVILIACGSLPIMMFVFSYISYSQGKMEAQWEPTGVVIVFAILKSIFWFLSCLYFREIVYSSTLNKVKKA